MTITGYTICIEDDGYSVEEITIDRQDQVLGVLQRIVGGYIEAIPSADSVTIWVNEEGKLQGLQENILAEQFYKPFDRYGCLKAGDWIAGNVVITGKASPSGRATSAPTNTLDLIRSLCTEEE